MNWVPDWKDGKQNILPAKAQIKDNIEQSTGSYLEQKCEACREKEVEILWDLNRRLMDALPEYFVDGRVMSGPVSILNGQSVSAVARAFKYEYTMEYAQNCKAYMTEEDFKNMVVLEIANEFRKEALKKETEGLVIVPYIPVQMIRSIDGDTFQPKIGFKTRYGLMKK